MLLGGDLAVLLAFVAIGRANHGQTLDISSISATALPFLVGACPTPPVSCLLLQPLTKIKIKTNIIIKIITIIIMITTLIIIIIIIIIIIVKIIIIIIIIVIIRLMIIMIMMIMMIIIMITHF